MTDVRLPVPAAVRSIVQTLEDAGFETWTVGGAVRDLLAGRPAGDWDLTTRARPGDVRRLFRRTVPIGVEHGTVGVLQSGGAMYEVTTFRKDVETDGRHAVVAFADDLRDDLARRDFTINAVAWHPLRAELCDPYDGAGDLRRGLLRTVGRPDERFAEDYLRVLRALRFAGRFGLRIEDGTWRALREAVPHLPSLSAERIRDELLKVLADDARPSRALGLYVDSGALEVLHPELAVRSRAPDWSVRLDAMDHLPRGRPYLRLAALLHGLDARATAQILVRLRLSNAWTDAVAHRVAAGGLPSPDASAAEIRRWIAALGPEHVMAVARIDLARARVGSGADAAGVVAAWRAAKSVLREAPPLAVGDLAIDGRHLIRMGLRPGPDFKRILGRLLDRVLDDPSANDADTLEGEVRRMLESGDV